MVLKFKYSSNPYLASPVVERLLQTGKNEYSWSDYDLMIPVPLHPRKVRERGFNQSAILGAALSRRTGIRFYPKSLIRVRYTKTQTRLSRRDRLDNVNGAFQASGKVPLNGKSILLIDDVYTTGATVNECATVLARAGVVKVDVLTLARARSLSE